MNDCTEALVKIKLAFRPGAVDLPEDQAEVFRDLLMVWEGHMRKVLIFALCGYLVVGSF